MKRITADSGTHRVELAGGGVTIALQITDAGPGGPSGVWFGAEFSNTEKNMGLLDYNELSALQNELIRMRQLLRLRRGLHLAQE